MPSRLLVLNANNRQTATVAAAIEDGEGDGIDKRSHSLRRAVWWALEDVAVPDAFLPYMGALAPSLVLNKAGATATNAIHRVWWKDDVKPGAIVLSSWTSLFAFAAELHGRHYGGGVLKIEPTQGGTIPIIADLAGADAAVKALDEMAREHGRTSARREADKLVLEGVLGLTSRD